MPRPEPKDYSAILEAVETIKATVLSLSQGGRFFPVEYRDIRRQLLTDPELKPYVPRFVRTCRGHDEVWAHLKDVASGDGSYRVRRKYVSDQFAPLLDYLESKVFAQEAPHVVTSAPDSSASAPHGESVTIALTALDSAQVIGLWTKAIERCEDDPEGAITAARSLMESTCKHLLDELDEPYKDSDDAPALYKKVARALDLAPSQHAEEMLKQVLGGACSIVGGMSAIANEHGDRHGGGKRRRKPSARHARLAVNAAGTVAAFLVDTWVHRDSAPAS